MTKRVSLAAITEVDAADGKLTIKAMDDLGEQIEVEMNADVLSALIPNLLASEAEMQGEREGKELGVVFYYGGAGVIPDRDQGYAILTLRCLAARPDRPPRKIGFRISARELEDLAYRCSTAARSPLLSSGRKPS